MSLSESKLKLLALKSKKLMTPGSAITPLVRACLHLADQLLDFGITAQLFFYTFGFEEGSLTPLSAHCLVYINTKEQEYWIDLDPQRTADPEDSAVPEIRIHTTFPEPFQLATVSEGPAFSSVLKMQ